MASLIFTQLLVCVHLLHLVECNDNVQAKLVDKLANVLLDHALKTWPAAAAPLLRRPILHNFQRRESPGFSVYLDQPRKFEALTASKPRHFLAMRHTSFEKESPPTLQPLVPTSFTLAAPTARTIRKSFSWLPFTSLSTQRLTPVMALPVQDEITIKQVMVQDGSSIAGFCDDQTPMYSKDVLDVVAVLVTESIFEPELSQGLSSSIRKYVYKKLQDRFVFRQSGQSALFLAFDGTYRDVVVGCIGVALVPINPMGETSGDPRAAFREEQRLRKFSKEIDKFDVEDLERVEVKERPLLEFLSVEASVRGRGIGTSLVERVERQVRNWGYHEVTLQVAAVNAVAIRMYEKMGYTVTAEDNTITRPERGLFGGMRFVPAPHLYMRKELGGD